MIRINKKNNLIANLPFNMHNELGFFPVCGFVKERLVREGLPIIQEHYRHGEVLIFLSVGNSAFCFIAGKENLKSFPVDLSINSFRTLLRTEIKEWLLYITEHMGWNRGEPTIHLIGDKILEL